MPYALTFSSTIDRVLASLPDAVAASARAVLAPFVDPLAIDGLDGPSFLRLPYWVAFPAIILTERRRSALDARSRATLDAVLRAQVCLFLATRLHDDLFDGQRGDPSAIYAGDALLLHAVREYQALFPRCPAFWSAFHAEVGTTWRAILATDAAQRLQGAGTIGSFARDYASINAVFRIGLAAACSARRRNDLLPSWSRCADALAAAEQLLDDFEDIVQDASRGRINAAAALLLRDAEAAERTGSDVTLTIAALLVTRGAGPLFDAIRALYRDAEDAARDLGSARALECIALRGEALRRIEEACHSRRVEHVFGAGEAAPQKKRDARARASH
ncbi:MAG: hypothetical protein IPP94_02045 [Ignavibacteria bacterium]|nr:hypothetical protein [Ignavibacteria bacterium]